MITSEQQSRLAARSIDAQCPLSCRIRPDVSPELMRKIVGVVDATRDPRPERVAEARARLLLGMPRSSDIAQRILAGVVSDYLR